MKSLSFRPRCRARGWCSSVRTGLGSCPPRSALPLILPPQPKQLQFLSSFLSICLSPLPSYRFSPLASHRVLAAFLLLLKQNWRHPRAKQEKTPEMKFRLAFCRSQLLTTSSLPPSHSVPLISTSLPPSRFFCLSPQNPSLIYISEDMI